MTTDNDNTPCFPIGTAAVMLGVSVQTLRLYESEGLLIVHKTPGRQRLYSKSDIRRIECIRHAINDEKISIGGIKRMQAMVPCWDIIGCSDAERNACAAFTKSSGGCWTYGHTHSRCAAQECRLCEVYLRSGECTNIREMIVSSTLQKQIASNERPL
ncbi:MAG: MerR family transcriptional regulator [Bacteroidetes bacterium]|nr:MerR family transcriptional regulator [Bacteroidota bacterium]